LIDVVGWQTETTSYTYDGDGLRTKKTNADGTISTYGTAARSGDI
jgi:YD repeat-containing protein